MSDLSLWDVYRTQTPLLAILDPLTATDLFYSMAADYNHTGRVPHWVSVIVVVEYIGISVLAAIALLIACVGCMHMRICKF